MSQQHPTNPPEFEWLDVVLVAAVLALVLSVGFYA